jgi:HAD superfamily hydrolase (TIGR01549 family)
MLKAIFFDWGYTFVKGYKYQNKELNKILKPFGLDWQKFRDIFRSFYLLRSAGRIKNDKEFELAIQRATQTKIPVKKIIEITIKGQIIPKEHIKIVRNLRRKYKVGILSNNVQEWVDKVLKNYKIENLFDAVIVSSKVGARKPDAIIYYEALKKLSVKSEEVVFIADELSEDLVVATGLGMKTIWLKTKEKGWWRENDERVSKIYQPDAVIKNLKEVIPAIKKWNKNKLEEIENFVKPFYKKRDKMHNFSHIKRFLRFARKLSKEKKKADKEIIICGAYFHGMIRIKEETVKRFLTSLGFSKEKINKIIQAAWESQKDKKPRTLEGKILHNAHLIEVRERKI